ncbi:MAG: ATP-binding cassette domain-containing protein [Pyrinomonadaceae bacterium]
MTAPSFSIGGKRASAAEIPAAANLALPETSIKISVRDLCFFYGRTQALYNLSIEVPERRVMAFIGPSGCGKSTFLRTLNRMNDTIAATRAEGRVEIDGRDIYAPGTDVVELRRKVGMVFQNPIRFRNQFSITWPTVCALTAWFPARTRRTVACKRLWRMRLFGRK